MERQLAPCTHSVAVHFVGIASVSAQCCTVLSHSLTSVREKFSCSHLLDTPINHLIRFTRHGSALFSWLQIINHLLPHTIWSSPFTFSMTTMCIFLFFCNRSFSVMSGRDTDHQVGIHCACNKGSLQSIAQTGLKWFWKV